MGGHKGYGISFIMDVLSGVLTGSGYATHVAGPYVPDQRSRCGHLVLALQIEAFLPRPEFEARIDDLIATTKAVPLAAGVEEIFYPGEIEARAEATRRDRPAFGCPTRPSTELRDLGQSCGVPLRRYRAEVVT